MKKGIIIAVAVFLLFLVVGIFSGEETPAAAPVTETSSGVDDAYSGYTSERVTSTVTEEHLEIEKETTLITEETKAENQEKTEISLSDIPEFSGKAFVSLNKNKPYFSKTELTTEGYEQYSALDSYGRCGVVVASLGKETMPKDGERRGSISKIKPSGWVQAQYSFISGKYLYNRCHLIGWQLSAENANRRNLITGTKYFNINGMLPFENMVADYIHETGNHVAYRVTPMYKGSDLVASGVQIEAYSIEDAGEGICFNVFCYNVQPKVVIDYSTGKSYTTVVQKETTTKKAATESYQENNSTYILNTNSKKIHNIDCRYVKKMKDTNKKTYSGNIDDLLKDGYTECGVCF